MPVERTPSLICTNSRSVLCIAKLDTNGLYHRILNLSHKPHFYEVNRVNHILNDTQISTSTNQLNWWLPESSYLAQNNTAGDFMIQVNWHKALFHTMMKPSLACPTPPSPHMLTPVRPAYAHIVVYSATTKGLHTIMKKWKRRHSRYHQWNVRWGLKHSKAQAQFQTLNSLDIPSDQGWSNPQRLL